MPLSKLVLFVKPAIQKICQVFASRKYKIGMFIIIILLKGMFIIKQTSRKNSLTMIN